MRILFVAPYYKPYLGGIERVIEKLAQQFVSDSNVEKIGVLTSKWSFPRRFQSTWPNEEIIDNEHIFRLNSWPSIAPRFFQVPLVWFSPWEIKKVVQEFKPNLIQLMSDRWFWVNFWVIYWARKEKIPVIFSLSFHQLSLLQQFLRPINGYLTRQSDKVQVITHHEKNLVQNAYKTPKEKFIVIPWGTEINTSSPQHHSVRGKQIPNTPSTIRCGASKYQKDYLTILSVGRISKHKGQFWLAQIYAQAHLSSPSNLVIIGEIEDPGVRKQIEEIQLPDDKEIIFTGNISEEELVKYYQQADLFTLFSEYEAFGLVFLEALSYGVPVLTHKVGAIEEILQQGVVLIEPYNKQQAIENLERLVNSAELRKQLSKEGHYYVLNNYSWEKTARNFLKIYQSNL